MASGTAHSTVSPPPVAHERKTAQVIERQLGRARFHVKLVDLLCHAALLAVGALVYLLVAAVADHWLLPGGLGFTGRALAFVGLVLLMGWFIVSFLGPLVLRAINPTYAARAIEEAQPSLKNSLINFLLLRQDRSGVREAVFDAVEQKAAADIAAVQVESAVDRTPIIRVGYVLVGVLALCAAYKILSPKDPFQTAARVALPWADIARPSRVQILELQPGNAKVYHGHTVLVTATINGTSEDSPVWLIYSTADGQTVDRKLRMKSRPGGIQFEAQLPPEDGQSPAIKPGLQQDVIYRVEAGDAATEDYRLTVVAAPTIVVQQLQYQFPPYTKKPPLTLDKQGDIQAIEGTKVTIHALANQAIASAFLELDPNDSPQGAAEIVPLQFDGQRAWGTITLQMAKDGITPWRASYHVRFTNDDGNKSEQPIRHQIDVQRDFPPEVQILAPTERRIEVPENGSRPIEVRGIDPDFGLTRVALIGDVRGKAVLNEELLKDDSQPPQAVARFVFRPKEHGLKAGDELVYHGLAADNRTSASGTADPNVATTSSYIIVVVPPQEQPKNQDEPPPQGDKPPPMENEKPQGDKPPMPMNDKRQEKPEEQQPKNEQTKNEQPKEGEKCPNPMQGDSQQKDSSQQGSKSEGAKGSKGEKSGNKSSQRQPNDGQNGEQQRSEDSASEGAKGQSQSGGKGQKSSGNPEQESPTDSAAGESSSDGRPMVQPSGNAQKPAGNQTGEPGDNSGEPSGASDQPSRPAHDGDAIEQINKLRQERQPQSGEPGAKREGTGDAQQDVADAASGEQPREPMDGNQEGSKTRSQEDKTSGEPKNAKTQSRDDSQSDKTKGSQREGPKGEKGTEKGAQKTNDAQGGKTGQASDQQGKTAQQPKTTAGEKTDGQKGEKTDGSDATGAKSGEKKQPGEKGSSGADKKQGEGNIKNEAGGKGGNPQGPMKTEKGEQPQPGEKGTKGEKKEPGMGKTGESGAGNAGKDEKGSGDSQEEGRDRPKELNPDGTQPKDSDPSPPAGSKKQSDSKGNDSGDKAGGGKKGAGQPAKQAGNDSAGENSPGDDGAGAANEQGQGPTGKKGGDQQKADGQTGAKGADKGDGKSGEKGKGNDAGGGAPPQGSQQPNSKGEQAKGDEPGQGNSGHVLGGGNQDQRPPSQPGEKGAVPDSDDANLEYAKKQTELALQYLKDQEHNPDPELLDRLGWTKEEMQEFVRRWDALQKAAADDPKASHELDESLRSLGLKPAKNRKWAGGAASDSVRDIRDSGTRTTAPKSYRDQFDNFRKGSR